MNTCAWICGAIILAFSIFIYLFSKSVYYLTFNTQNGVNFQPSIAWDKIDVGSITLEAYGSFQRDGAVHLPNFLPTHVVENMKSEFNNVMTTQRDYVNDFFVPKNIPFYKYYTHAMHTKNELFYDWAMHGPFAKWAAELMGVDTVRLYNVEMIAANEDFPACNPFWHRDTLACPAKEGEKTAVFNVYLQDINTATQDGLIYLKGTHKVDDNEDEIWNREILDFNLTIGDVLVHDANTIHTTSGVGCFGRKSIQLRYVDGDATYWWDRYRSPSVWHWVHSWPSLGLQKGDKIGGPWYPQVYPTIIPEERKPITVDKFYPFGDFFSAVDEIKDSKDPQDWIGFDTLQGTVKNVSKWEKHGLLDLKLRAWHPRGEGATEF